MNICVLNSGTVKGKMIECRFFFGHLKMSETFGFEDCREGPAESQEVGIHEGRGSLWGRIPE